MTDNKNKKLLTEKEVAGILKSILDQNESVKARIMILEHRAEKGEDVTDELSSLMKEVSTGVIHED